MLYGHTHSKSMDQPGKVANRARGQLNREMNISMSPFASQRIWSHETGSPVPSCVSLLISISILWLNLVLTYNILPDFHGRRGVHLYI